MGNTFDNDDYDSPTEPMIPIILAPRSPARPPLDGQNGHTNGATAGPAQHLQPASSSQPVSETPLDYPLLPPTPGTNHNGRPPGGAAPSGNGNGRAALPEWPVTPDGLTTPVQPYRSPVPTVIGVCFVVVQVLLLARVLLLLFNVNNIAAWVRVFYNLSGIFIWPFRLLVDHIQLLASIRPELVNYVSPLVAILVYGLISRILVRFLKALLNSH